MAGILGHVTSGDTIIAGGAPRTLLQIVAAANHRIKVTGISVMIKGTGTNDVPVRVRLLRQPTEGVSQAAVPVKNNPVDPEILQTSARKNFSGAEPATTDADVLQVWALHPQTGTYILLPFGQEIIVPGGGRLALEVLGEKQYPYVANYSFEE